MAHCTLSVTVPFPVSQSINVLAPAQLISVPVHQLTVSVSVIALVMVVSTDEIMNLSVLHTQVSNAHVAVLIPAWITLATQSISVTAEKSNQVIFLATPLIVIANSPSS